MIRFPSYTYMQRSMSMACGSYFLLGFGLLFSRLQLSAYDVPVHYVRAEFSVPMRDGVKLYTSVLMPTDKSRAYPILLWRTPYVVPASGYEKFMSSVLEAGYILVMQNVRGRWLSEGMFHQMTPYRSQKMNAKEVDESSDTFDTVDWLLRHVDNHNGKVGLWGFSYPGFYVAAGMIDTHPAIKAASPQATQADFFLGDDWYHGGAFRLATTFGFSTDFKPQSGPTVPPSLPTPYPFHYIDAYEFFLQLGTIAETTPLIGGSNPTWDETIAHPVYDDYWRDQAIWRHMKGVKCAVLNVGGWFDDADFMGTLRVYHAVEENNPGLENNLVIGPWLHCGWAENSGRRLGNVDFESDTGKYFREMIELPFFERHLKGEGDLGMSEVQVFETGSNAWRKYLHWPPPEAKARMLYLRENRGLSFDLPANQTGSDSYNSDPAKPVPSVGYIGDSGGEYMVSDQRFAARRPDVLVYQTVPLEEDVTIVGPISPKLFVSTSGTDADWVVKLIDVYPDLPVRPAGSENALQRTTNLQPPQIVLPSLAGYQQLGCVFKMDFGASR